MPAKLPHILSAPLLIGLLGCAPCKEADILAAAAVAELAQSQNVRPSELTVEKVTFQNRLRAQVDLTHRLRDTRLPHNDAFSCEAARVDSRWNVRCMERQTP